MTVPGAVLHLILRPWGPTMHREPRPCAFCSAAGHYNFHRDAVLCPDHATMLRTPLGEARRQLLRDFPGLARRIADWPMPKKRK